MAESRHRKSERKKGVRVRRQRGRRRSTVAEQQLTRVELKAAAAKRAKSEARRRIAAALVVSLLLIWSAVVLSWWLSNRNEVDGPVAPVAEVPDQGASALIGIVDDDDKLVSLSLFAVSESAGSRLVLFHPSLLTTLPGFGENVLANTVRFQGEALVESPVTNLLGILVDEVVLMTRDEVAAAIETPLTIDLPVPLVVADGTAQVVVAGTGPGLATV
jgi:hypothetical protein